MNSANPCFSPEVGHLPSPLTRRLVLALQAHDQRELALDVGGAEGAVGIGQLGCALEATIGDGARLLGLTRHPERRREVRAPADVRIVGKPPPRWRRTGRLRPGMLEERQQELARIREATGEERRDAEPHRSERDVEPSALDEPLGRGTDAIRFRQIARAVVAPVGHQARQQLRRQGQELAELDAARVILSALASRVAARHHGAERA